VTEIQGDMLKCFTVNAVGPVLVTQAALPLLRASKHVMGPRILYVSSNNGSLALRERDHLVGKLSYGASKCALNMMIRAMSHEITDVAMVL